MKKLIIVESPSKVKTISKFFSSNVFVDSTKGHVKDLPSKKIGVSVDQEKQSIEVEYVFLEKKDKVVQSIVKLAKKVDEVYLAPDPDREGEVIAWHIEQEILEKTKNKVPVYRIVFNEITKQAIENALLSPSEIKEDLVKAQQARRILDRWVGYKISPILWRKVSPGLSAVRVQSVALKLVCVREQEIRKFVSREYWTIHGLFASESFDLFADFDSLQGKKLEFEKEEDAQKVTKDFEKNIWSISDIKKTKRSRKPYPPFTTSTLQQAAYNKLGFNVQKTMQLAQKLYEGVQLGGSSTQALITYMRTDSVRVSDSALKDVRGYIDSHLGKDYLPTKAYLYSSKKSSVQDAHEAIRPISLEVKPDDIEMYVEKDLVRLYELIWRRFVASQMSAASYAQTAISISSEGALFKASGSILIFDGFLSIYQSSEDSKAKKDKVLPSTIKVGDTLNLKELDFKQHFTQPPARYTESSLVKELEEKDIGRPSTYATILRTIRDREYTTLDEKKRFVPTELGMRVVTLLDEYMSKIMDVSFTAQMEEKLDNIARGKINRDKVLLDFYKDFEKDLAHFADQKVEKAFEKTDIDCPKECGEKLLLRRGRSGEFLGCEGYPECSYTSGFARDEQGKISISEKEAPKFLSVACPSCKKQLREIVGRYGKFIACSGYPECKYIHQIKTSSNCPKCDEKKLVKRTWKGRIFWGCEGYPKCKFSIPGDIEEVGCTECKSSFMRILMKNGEKRLVCVNKDCPSTIKNVEKEKA